MDYQETIEWLEGLANPERTGLGRSFADEMSLDATRRLMSLLGRPHEQIEAVHIAGTKGKGSVAAMIESTCRHAGMSTGLFTSPHLVSWRERIRIGGHCIDRKRVADIATDVRSAVEQVENEGLRPPSFFEAITSIAMMAFAEAGPDICVLETGLGGRLDATNVVSPRIAVITTIDLDHTEILGETLPEIAMQKAGIMKPSVPVVCAPQTPEVEQLLRRTAEGLHAPISFVEPYSVLEADPLDPEGASGDDLPVLGERISGSFRGFPFHAHLPLAGAHQAVNAAVAGRVCELLHRQYRELPPDALKTGLERVHWPARVELIDTHPWLVVDCAHNPASAKALMTALDRHLHFDRMILVLAASGDKSVQDIAAELHKADHTICTQAGLPRAMPAAELAERTADMWRSCEVVRLPVEAFDRARDLAGPRDLICVTGSVFLLGDLMEAGKIEIPLYSP